MTYCRNFQSAQKFQAVSEQSYDSVLNSMAKAISPIRVNKIRKMMEFKPVPYDVYLKMGDEFAEGNADDFEETPKAYFLETDFDLNFFPNFSEEFFEHYNYINRKFAPKSYDWQGYTSVYSDNYHSLVYASYEITNAVTEVWKKTPSLSKQGMSVVCPSYWVGGIQDVPDRFKVSLTIAVV